MSFLQYAVSGAGRPWRAGRPPCTAPLAPRPAGRPRQPGQALADAAGRPGGERGAVRV